ncbi:hypothetical protein N658DRAFT_307274 [Parathielavia hyrcaniae]|uniref:Uncharacterized protein n=1 Tax=Parathielavia hyrcaniae TaxID=113614 RepID=A0AAN6T420_9PEZI|nr:hypothetical protein N658DRAFT_307274 [Parathielavia hyrcaniae]
MEEAQKTQTTALTISIAYIVLCSLDVDEQVIRFTMVKQATSKAEGLSLERYTVTPTLGTREGSRNAAYIKSNHLPRLLAVAV